MYTRVKILGHPLHVMLIPYPIAFNTAALLGYIAFYFIREPFWFHLAHVANVAGLIAMALAAVPGIIDWWFGIPRGTRPKRTGLWHMLLNLLALTLFSANAYIQAARWDEGAPALTAALILTGAGVLSMIAAGFKGWSLVQYHHVGVDALMEPMPRKKPEEDDDVVPAQV